MLEVVAGEVFCAKQLDLTSLLKLFAIHKAPRMAQEAEKHSSRQVILHPVLVRKVP